MINQKALDRRIKRHIIAGSHRFFTAIQPGLEEAGVMELTRLGLSPVREKEPGSLCCEGSLEMLWKTALLARSISRLYLRLDSFKTTSFKELKQKFSRIPWELYLREGCVYRIKMTTRHCRLHVDDKITKALNHCLREHFTKLGGTIPVYSDRKEKNPAVQTLVIRGLDDHFSISLDAGGGALYERGYRKYVNGAPLKENIAASLLILAERPEKTLLLDPMTGSGTFALEGLGCSLRAPVSPQRVYPFEYWPSFRPHRYEWIKNKINENRKPGWKIRSSDSDVESLDAARTNLKAMEEQCQLENLDTEILKEDFFTQDPLPVSGDWSPFLILNPPYGKRLALKDQQEFFRSMGQQISLRYKGIPWGIIVPGLECEKSFGLRWERKYIFKNGGYPVSYLLGVCR